MSRLVHALTIALTAAAAGSAAAQSTTVNSAGITLHAESFSPITSSREFAGGPAADVMNANCTTCHSAGMVLNQPALSAADWQGEVNKMRSAYKAPVSAEDVPAILAYLTSLKPAH